ncbi:uncharacterized protein HKW66_Vig0115620 [Vigna angularis]|uniref:Uncharacterized protein n=1 Tax=Phaseolus angularis TaxID=3914 RepID=A0A8T0KWB9_PHAAN|nr:uncharacterized protein HKW66_Vig0115620 [Vigna angularis]
MGLEMEFQDNAGEGKLTLMNYRKSALKDLRSASKNLRYALKILRSTPKHLRSAFRRRSRCEEAAHAAQRQREVLTASLGTVILVVGRWRKEEGKGSLRKKKKEEGKGSLRKNKKEEGKEV